MGLRHDRDATPEFPTIVFEDNEQKRLVEFELMMSVTLPVKSLRPVSVTVAVAEAFTRVASLVGLATRLKLGAAITRRITDTECCRGTFVPVIVML